MARCKPASPITQIHAALFPLCGRPAVLWRLQCAVCTSLLYSMCAALRASYYLFTRDHNMYLRMLLTFWFPAKTPNKSHLSFFERRASELLGAASALGLNFTAAFALYSNSPEALCRWGNCTRLIKNMQNGLCATRPILFRLFAWFDFLPRCSDERSALWNAIMIRYMQLTNCSSPRNSLFWCSMLCLIWKFGMKTRSFTWLRLILFDTFLDIHFCKIYNYWIK